MSRFEAFSHPPTSAWTLRAGSPRVGSPRAIVEFAKTYRFRSLSGASAGAIGAGFGAAAEYAQGNTSLSTSRTFRGNSRAMRIGAVQRKQQRGRPGGDEQPNLAPPLRLVAPQELLRCVELDKRRPTAQRQRGEHRQCLGVLTSVQDLVAQPRRSASRARSQHDHVALAIRLRLTRRHRSIGVRWRPPAPSTSRR